MCQTTRPAVEKGHIHGNIRLEEVTKQNVPNATDDGYDYVKQKVNNPGNQQDDDNSKHVIAVLRVHE